MGVTKAKKRCFFLPSVGGTIIDLNDVNDDEPLRWLGRQLQTWARSAKPDDEFVLVAKRVTQSGLDALAEYDADP